ncbi:hypothetical protein V5O48_018921 [Marasmius crinis-equi]|uniref:Uncharacterized protein n=1 Tax=Marasmius crinis-equi TaxID=585013 RepID=A0ABR3EJY3_9AGAR
MTLRGAAIGEGDALGLSIRLARELAVGRFSFPEPESPNDALSLHELGLLSEIKSRVSKASADQANNLILPRARALVEAVGARIASEAASSDPKIDSALLKLFKNSCIQRDLAWYVENGVVSRKQVFDEEAILLDELLPKLGTLLATTGVEPYIHAKICEEDTWRSFVGGLPIVGERPRESKL